MLDEPSAGLSPVLVDRVLVRRAAGCARRGTAVLLVEQLIEKALARRRSRLCAGARLRSCWKRRTDEADLPHRLEHAYHRRPHGPLL